MKITEKVDKTQRVEKLTEEERDDFFTRLITGKDVTEEVETSKGIFIIKFPKVGDLLSIGRIAAVRRGHRPVEGFDAETEMLNMMASTLDVIVVSGPNWYENAVKTNPNFTFLEVPSREFLAELFGKAYSFREKVEQRLKEGQKHPDKRVSSQKSADAPVDGGIFGGLAGELHDTAA